MERHFAGRPAAPGIALGVLIALTAGNSARVATGAAESEADALRSALHAARADLKALIERSTGDAAAILEFQVALVRAAFLDFYRRRLAEARDQYRMRGAGAREVDRPAFGRTDGHTRHVAHRLVERRRGLGVH